MKLKGSYSIVIPAYNEEHRILSTLEKIITFFHKYRKSFELIIIDDGSTDGTCKIVRNLGNPNVILLKNTRNRGKGFSVRKGCLAASNDYILVTDADLSTPIEELLIFDNTAAKYDLQIGSRKMPTSKLIVKQPIYRILAGNLFPILVTLLVTSKYQDTQCGFKVFNRKKTKFIFKKLSVNGFSFDVEILYIAQKYGLKIKEIGVIWVNDTRSKVSLVKHTLPMFIDLMKIRYNDFRGLY